MKKHVIGPAALCAMLGLAGCGGPSVLESHPLFFAQGITYGFSGGTARRTATHRN